MKTKLTNSEQRDLLMLVDNFSNEDNRVRLRRGIESLIDRVMRRKLIKIEKFISEI